MKGQHPGFIIDQAASPVLELLRSVGRFHCGRKLVGGGMERNKECEVQRRYMPATSLPWCLTLRHPDGGSPTRLLCPWDSQARILEWVAVSSSRGSS